MSVRSLSTSIKSLFTHPDPTASTSKTKMTASDMQADLARLTNTLRALPEVQGTCWRGEDCELSEGVKQGVRRFATHAQVHADMLEQRVSVLSTHPPLCASLRLSGLSACHILDFLWTTGK